MKSFPLCTAMLFCMAMLAPSNSFAQWQQTNGPFSGNILSMTASGTTLYAGTCRGGVFRSTDNGAAWTPLGLSEYILITSLAVNGTDLYAIGINDYYGGPVFRYSGSGTVWTQVAWDMPANTVFSLVKVIRSGMFVATSPGLYRTTDNGAHWTPASSGLTEYGRFVNDLAEAGPYVFAATERGVYRSADSGITWSMTGAAMASEIVKTLAVIGSDLYAGVSAGGVFRSSDMGATWTLVTAAPMPKMVTVHSLAAVDTVLFAATDMGAFRSADKGATWTLANQGLTITSVEALVSTGKDLFAGTPGGGVCRSSNYGTSWSPASVGMVNSSVTALWIGSSAALAGTERAGIFRSLDGGANWTYMGLTDTAIYAIAACGMELFAGTESGLYHSSDNGVSWTAALDTVLSKIEVRSLLVSGSTLIAGGYNGVYLSSDQGKTWTHSDMGVTDPFGVFALALMEGKIAASTDAGVYVSANGGTQWTQISSNRMISSLAACGTELYGADENSSLYLFKEAGQSWTSTSLGLSGIRSLVMVDSTLLMGRTHGMMSLKVGQARPRWGDIGGDRIVNVLAASGTHLYAGTVGGGVSKRSLSQILTSVDASHLMDVPADFSLGQNFPNPFNPSTTISFSLPSRALVTLTVFDVMGREVSRLVNEELPAGGHTARWNAWGLSSGVYYYRLQAGGFTDTKRLLLVK